MSWWVASALEVERLRSERQGRKLVFHVRGQEYRTEHEAQRAAVRGSQVEPIEMLPPKLEMN